MLETSKLISASHLSATELVTSLSTEWIVLLLLLLLHLRGLSTEVLAHHWHKLLALALSLLTTKRLGIESCLLLRVKWLLHSAHAKVVGLRNAGAHLDVVEGRVLVIGRVRVCLVHLIQILNVDGLLCQVVWIAWSHIGCVIVALEVSKSIISRGCWTCAKYVVKSIGTG